jgi:hypothetical protein
VNLILSTQQTTQLAAGFWQGAGGTAIFAALMVGVGVKEMRSDFPPVKDVHPLTLITLGASMVCFSGAMALDPGRVSTLLIALGAALIVLAIVVQILFWTKRLPRMFWTPYQAAQEKLGSVSKMHRSANKRK